MESDEDISQGDIVQDIIVPVLEATDSRENHYFVTKYSPCVKVIVLTQACDLERRDGKRDAKFVTVCELMPLREWLQKILPPILKKRVDIQALLDTPESEDSKTMFREIESLRKGEYVEFHLLERLDGEDGLELDYMVTNFSQIHRMPVDSIETHCKNSGKKRHRLLPPYREHLSQAFARTFMRIGLPTDLNVDPSKL